MFETDHEFNRAHPARRGTSDERCANCGEPFHAHENGACPTPECETAGCRNLVDEPGDLCHGCEADNSHRGLWGSGIPMSHHAAS